MKHNRRLSFKPQIGMIEFLGSNCDQDCIDVLKRHFDIDVKIIWHDETTLPPIDGLILPGGFSYGDFLRCGSLASHCKIIPEVKKFIQKGGPVIGICNGFQILTEAKLLPGCLLKNLSGKFVCKNVKLNVINPSKHFANIHIPKGTIELPIAHGGGRYYIDEVQLQKLIDNGQILFRYTENPNGSIYDIAGITDITGKVWGMMPHPERATDSVLKNGCDGLKIWEAFLNLCG